MFALYVDNTLRNCSGVTDVKGLAGAKEVSLVRCSGITDVAALGGIEKLDLMGLKLVENVSDILRVLNRLQLNVNHSQLSKSTQLVNRTAFLLKAFLQARVDSARFRTNDEVRYVR